MLSGLAHAGAQPLGDQAEKLVADRVPERVVDGLEVVEVETENGEPFAAPQIRQATLHLFAEGGCGSADRSARRAGPCVRFWLLPAAGP